MSLHCAKCSDLTYICEACLIKHGKSQKSEYISTYLKTYAEQFLCGSKINIDDCKTPVIFRKRLDKIPTLKELSLLSLVCGGSLNIGYKERWVYDESDTIGRDTIFSKAELTKAFQQSLPIKFRDVIEDILELVSYVEYGESIISLSLWNPVLAYSQEKDTMDQQTLRFSIWAMNGAIVSRKRI